jgi:transposase-like protein
MTHPCAITPTVERHIWQLRERGKTWQQIAADIGVNPLTVYRWRKRQGLPDKRLIAGRLVSARQRAVVAEFDEPIADTIVGLRNMGLSWADVAGAMDVPQWTLRDWRRSLGLVRHAVR